jgi:hypothetical protein
MPSSEFRSRPKAVLGRQVFAGLNKTHIICTAVSKRPCRKRVDKSDITVCPCGLGSRNMITHGPGPTTRVVGMHRPAAVGLPNRLISQRWLTPCHWVAGTQTGRRCPPNSTSVTLPAIAQRRICGARHACACPCTLPARWRVPRRLPCYAPRCSCAAWAE